ncbi:MAG: 1-aminocyclopropane-1-carboxylate deaminase/D-cysteine desulfhydrase [Longimicrobiales bacterium]
MPSNALFRRFPALAGRLPWVPLGRFPTPVHRLPLPGRDDTWIKRDDLSAPLYGGNKVRKLEFLLADARRRGATRLITIGAAGSHHALATTLYGCELGFDVTLVLFPQPPADRVRRVLRLDACLGAKIRWVPATAFVPLGVLAARLAHQGERLYVVPVGGSNALGTLGYVAGALELAEQIEAGQTDAPQVVHVAAGTLGTAAGIAIGFALAGIAARVVATRVVSPVVTNERRLGRLVRSTLRLLADAGMRVPVTTQVLARIELSARQVGAGYGHATEAGERAREALAVAGVCVDDTYTAKAAAELLQPSNTAGPVLFWHTYSGVHPLDLRPVPRLPRGAERYLRALAACGPV